MHRKNRRSRATSFLLDASIIRIKQTKPLDTLTINFQATKRANKKILKKFARPRHRARQKNNSPVFEWILLIRAFQVGDWIQLILVWLWLSSTWVLSDVYEREARFCAGEIKMAIWYRFGIKEYKFRFYIPKSQISDYFRIRVPKWCSHFKKKEYLKIRRWCLSASQTASNVKWVVNIFAKLCIWEIFRRTDTRRRWKNCPSTIQVHSHIPNTIRFLVRTSKIIHSQRQSWFTPNFLPN